MINLFFYFYNQLGSSEHQAKLTTLSLKLFWTSYVPAPIFFYRWICMKGRLIALFLLLVTVLLPLHAAPVPLRQGDIRRVMDRLLAYHIENKDLSPAIARRCFKLYIEHFDSDKAYLLSSEALPFLQMSDEEAFQVIARIRNEDYRDFDRLNQVLQRAILRAQEIRSRIVKETVASNAELVPSFQTPPAQYAQNEQELAARQKNRMGRFYAYHKQRSDLSTQQRKEKLFVLFEKKARRNENNYLFLKPDGREMDRAAVEHLLSLRVLKSFAKSLDTHTSFFSPEEAYEMRMSLEKQFDGVGIVLFEGVDGVSISELIRHSPAEQSKQIRINDLLVEIDGASVESLSFEEVLDLLKKSDSPQIILGFKRMSEGKSASFRVPLEKRPIVMSEDRIVSSYEKFEDGIIGKISLYSFYESSDGMSSERDIKQAIREFQRVAPLRGLVLDLRENSGGFLSQAIRVAGLFLSNGIVAISKYGKGELHYLRNIVGRSFFTGPLVVLTSKMSASASEIVAQALQDYGVALVVGDERTFGKGSIQYQTVTDLQAELFFKVTVGKYYTASGRTTQIEGVKADIVVPSHYAPYHIGEKYLEYPLSSDRIDSVYLDPLTDLDEKTKLLFERKYMPYLQRVVSFWKKALPALRQKSQQRLARNAEFQALLKRHEKIRARAHLLPPNSIDEAPPAGPDIQMAEAINVVKDMISIEIQSQPAALKQPLPLQRKAS